MEFHACSRSIVRSLTRASFFGALLLGSTLLQAQDPAGNPTGSAGSFNGETNEGGSLDPYTGNAKRIVTDLTVPGSNGAYPLAFTRIWNSRFGTALATDDHVLAPQNWRHSYQWTIQPATPGASSYLVAYPDGRVSTFRGDRNNSPADPLYRGPTGTSDRLEVSASALPILHLSDGGAVVFGLNCNGYAHALRIVDPYGANTILSYSPSNGLLTSVTEPGGRSLSFTYNSPVGALTLLATVTASQGAANSIPQVVTYSYSVYAAGLALRTVSYGEAGNSTAANSLPATYDYDGNTPSQLVKCVDSHAAGPMTTIGYTYNASVGVSGLVTSEFYPIGNIPVTTLTQSPAAPTGNCVATVVRGDKSSTSQTISRQLVYGTTRASDAMYLNSDNQTASRPFGARAYQITSSGDYLGNATVTCYNSAYDATHAKSFPVMQIDRLLHATQFETEPITGRVTKTILPDLRTRTAGWAYGCCASDTVGTYYLVQTVNERGQTTTYHRNAETHLVETIDYPGNAHESFTYQAFTGVGGYTYYKLKTFTNRLGSVTQYQYTPVQLNGLIDNLAVVRRSWTCAVAPTSGTQNTYLHYDANNRVDQVSDDLDSYVRYLYDSENRVSYVFNADASNSNVRYLYDAYGNNVSIIDELAHTTSFTYDDYRRVTSSTAPISKGVKAVTNLFYDRRNTDYNVVSPAMSHTSSSPSLLEMPADASTNVGNATLRIFNPNGLAETEVEGLQWDGSHQNPYNVPASFYTTTSYDAGDRPYRHTNHKGYASIAGYDNCDRLISSTDENGHSSTVSFYASGMFCGWPQTLTAPGNNAASTIVTTIADYSNLGQPKAVVDNLNHTFNTSYDFAGNTTAQNDGLHPATTYTLDTLGRLRKLLYQDSTAEQWTYDASGNANTYTARSGEIRTTNYDQRNRPYHSEWSMGGDSPIDRTYNVKGQLVSASNWASTVGFTYDNRGLVSAETQNISGTSAGVQTVTYNRSADGKILSMQYPGGRAPLWVYNSLNECVGCQGYTALSWSAGWLNNRLLSNGINTDSSDRQRDGRLNTQLTSRNGVNFSVRSYGYYPNGQMSFSSKSDNGLGESFFYEGTGQLQSSYGECNNVPAPGSSPHTTAPGDQPVPYPSYCQQFRQYAYDAAGNPTNILFNNSSFTNGFDAANRWIGLTYDSNGDLSGDAAGWSYYFVSGGMLRIGNGPGGASGSFLCDPLGRKCAGILPGGAVQCFLYAGNQRIEERDSTNTVGKYVYYYDSPGSDSIAARFDAAAGNPLYYTYDARGNTTHLTDASGQVVEKYYYDAFGLPYIQDGSGNLRAGNVSAYDNRFLWNAQSGYEWLAGMGIYHAGARDYRPDLGRWMQPDPVGQAGGLNIYGYCGNDPINRSDPSGLASNASPVTTQAEQGDTRVIVTGTVPRNLLPDNFRITQFIPVSGGYYIRGIDGSTGIDSLASDPTAPSSVNGIVVRPLIYSPPESAEPGAIASMIPIYGNAMISRYAFSTGHPIRGVIYAGLAASDVFLVKSLATSAIKGGVTLAAKLTAAEGGALEARGGTYLLRNAETGQVMRTGRTNDLLRREVEHARDPVLKNFEFEPAHRMDVYEEQRGLEQLLHETHNPPLNKIQPISSKNPRLQEYLDAATRFLNNQ